MQEKIGEGEFGIVFSAKLLSLSEYNSITETKVAVKVLKDNSGNQEIKNFIKELLIMKSVGIHENIIKLLGVSKDLDGKIVAVFEYARFGNLRDYLRNKRLKNKFDLSHSTSNCDLLNECIKNRFYNHHSLFDTVEIESNAADKSTSKNSYDLNKLKRLSKSTRASKSFKVLAWIKKGRRVEDGDEEKYNNDQLISNDYMSDYDDPTMIRNEDLISFAYQIAHGMDFLHNKKLLHRDLAARNILVYDNNVVKIADFGFARYLDRKYYYRRQSDGRLPLKWMSPEYLADSIVTTYSDVWSYGVLLWEIFSLGKNPYPSIPLEELFDRLKDGYRMQKPEHCEDEM